MVFGRRLARSSNPGRTVVGEQYLARVGIDPVAIEDLGCFAGKPGHVLSGERPELLEPSAYGASPQTR